MKQPEKVRYIQVDYIWNDPNHHTAACAFWHSSPTATYFDEEEILLSQHLNATALVIPDSIAYQGKNIPVVCIGYEGFLHCNLLQYVALPNTIRDFGEFAFADCQNLKGIALPEHLEDLTIGFAEGCSRLKELPLPHTLREMSMTALMGTQIDHIVLPDSLHTIAPYVFAHCNDLTHIVIPASVKEIHEEAFAHCENLEAIHVAIENPHFTSLDGVLMSRDLTTLHQYPAGKKDKSYAVPREVTEIGSGAFAGNRHLQMADLPAHITEIPKNTFEDCCSLTDIDIPEGVETMGNNAFYHCTSLRDITLPASLKEIESMVFDSCIQLTAVNLPDSLTSIDDYAFRNCSSITDIVLPQSLETLGTWVFYNCTSLRSVTFPDKHIPIKASSFYGCSKLEELHLKQLVPLSYPFDNGEQITLYVPKHLIKEAQQRSYYKRFKKIQGE